MRHRHLSTGKHYVGAYSPESRRRRIERFLEKRKRRVWTRKVKYDVRKNFADTRMRVKGRFVRLDKSRSEQGSGLGLALVDSVMKLHGGDFEIEDANPGLTAKLRFPVRV